MREVTQVETINFLKENGMNVENMSYNQINDIMSISDKIAEEAIKEFLLILCKCDRPTEKGGLQE